MSRRANGVVRVLARFASWVFYRIDRIGEAPPSGAVLLLPNHPNSLLDPALVWATSGRDVRFLAKSTLFDGPMRPLLAGAGALPVYRRIDEGVDSSRNAETFAAVAAALAEGDAVCLFPEGITHSSGRLETLRTGAARMALSAARAGTSVAIVPVGINLDRKTAFRSRVTVAFGRPFSCDDLLPATDAALPASVRALTDRIREHIRLVLVEADPRGDGQIVDRVERLYAAARGRPDDPAERLARRRVIAAGIERLRTAAPERYDEILLRVRRYDQRLRRFRLRDSHLDWNVSSASALRFAARELLLGIVLIPLCLLGLVVFFVPYWLTGLVARLTAPQHAILATAQLIGGAFIYGAWVALGTTAAWSLKGRTAGLATALAMPALAFAALFAIERESAVIDAVRAWWSIGRSRHDTRERLRRRRSELADVLDEVHKWMTDTAEYAPQ
jgi:1-acyl-sn-glycerol-3-phosphate acyltransferase